MNTGVNNMRFRALLFLLTAGLGIAFSFMAGLAQTSTGFAYYVLLDPQAGGQVGIIDSDATVQFVDIPIESNWSAPTVPSLSPDGVWLAYTASVSGADSEGYLRLLNLETNEVRDLTGGYVLDMAWSPHSRLLAISRRSNASQEFDIFIYTVASNFEQNLSNDGLPHPEIEWSTDSTKLAFSTFSCPDIENCLSRLEVIDLDANLRQRSPDFLDFVPIGAESCKLNWSPDNRFVSFVLGCNPSADVAREVFLWDTTNEELMQLTNFTMPAYEPGGLRVSPGTYELLWNNADTLLISAFYGLPTDQFMHEMTYSYSISVNDPQPLFGGYVSEWVLNPLTGQIVADRATPRDIYNQPIVTDLSFVPGIILLTLNNTIGGQEITDINRFDLPPGCNFHWSPDGTRLVYSIPPTGCPDLNTERFVFVDAATGEYTEFTPMLPDGSVPLAVVPLGWVQR
jgi:hypothetical protein